MTLVALSVPASAAAVPPVITSVSQQNRHVAITFAAPRADGISVYIANKPDRATDGQFLQENIKEFDLLADSEVQAGRWLDDHQIDPGSYWVMIDARPDFDSCYRFGGGGYDPACADGFSDLVPLIIPRPAVKYAASVTAYKYIHRASLTLRATPLGDKQPYKVCFALKTRKRQCLSGTLSGYGWNFSTDDSLTVNTTKLPTLATFTWYVGSKAVASKRARVR
jgi:hypothetical protein